MTYVDSDGVLADFNGWIKKVNPSALKHHSLIHPTMIEHCDECFLVFETMPGSDFFFEKIKTTEDWKVLSAVPSREKLEPFVKGRTVEEVISIFKENKYRWYEKHGVSRDKVIIVEGGLQKLSYCKPGDVLYDDFIKNIKAWEAKGGIGHLVKITAEDGG